MVLRYICGYLATRGSTLDADHFRFRHTSGGERSPHGRIVCRPLFHRNFDRIAGELGVQMAPLYKRYIPPKPSATPTLPSTSLAAKNDQNSVTNDVPKKRKRERTEEEIAERKAKKLRKKGIDPATVLNQSSAQENRVTEVKSADPNQDDVQNVVNERGGEFAHVKNTKKRHKLEKEARKSRKLAKGDSNDAEVNREDVLVNTGRGDVNFDVEVAGQRPEGTNYANLQQTKKQKQHAGSENEVSPDLSKSKTTEDVAELKKKGKKDKRRKAQDSIQLRDEYKDGSAPPEGVAASTLSQPKKRRHKLESVLEVTQCQPQNESMNDDEHLRKHEGVMSKFQKSKQLSQIESKPTVSTEKQQSTKPIVLDLAPLPQPEKVPTPDFVPDPSALPEWLAKPTIVSNDVQVSFEQLKLEPKLVQRISKLGFENAMPVQQALIPILLVPGTSGARFLPGSASMLPDVAVGAPTGSGKTIAYLLPIIESLRTTAGLGRLKALVVVPTRELVMQVAAVGESLARGSGMKIGIATGTGSFKDEQTKLVKIGRKYDPDAYQKLMSKAHLRNYPPAQDSDEFLEYLEEIENQDVKGERRIRDAITCLIDHVPTYDSAVDILVATPGRLLEHLRSTLGFSIAYLDWLVLDEADKLIDQQYQGFLETVNKELERPHLEEEQDARERYLRSKGCWNERRERHVRKVVLSATMTRDISKLMDLKLKRPRMILVRGQEESLQGIVGDADISIGESTGVQELKDGFELPPTLTEYCTHVGDGSEKPLYLAYLLDTRILAMSKEAVSNSRRFVKQNAADDSDSDVKSSRSSRSAHSAESDADIYHDGGGGANESSMVENNGHVDRVDELVDNEAAMHPERVAMLEKVSSQQRFPRAVPTVLVFTSSTEAANRLAHLLKKLNPDLESCIYTMTRADPKKNHFAKTKTTDPIVVVSTDRTSRGLDAIANRRITHVVQYDVPRSATGYVHRVGRTARAGKPGEAWTLYTHSEARWFLNEVSRAEIIKRSVPVDKVKLNVKGEGMRERLGDAIAEIRDEVYSRGGNPN